LLDLTFYHRSRPGLDAHPSRVAARHRSGFIPAISMIREPVPA